jgi:hypothetical protein
MTITGGLNRHPFDITPATGGLLYHPTAEDRAMAEMKKADLARLARRGTEG